MTQRPEQAEARARFPFVAAWGASSSLRRSGTGWVFEGRKSALTERSPR